MKVWITKYALTRGIIEADAVPDLGENFFALGIIRVGFSYHHKPFWHDNKAAAIVHAEELRQRAINSTRKKLAALEKMRFD